MPDIKHGHGDARQLQNFSQGERRQKKKHLITFELLQAILVSKGFRAPEAQCLQCFGKWLAFARTRLCSAAASLSASPLTAPLTLSCLSRHWLTLSLSLYPGRPVASFRLTPTPRASHEPALFILFGYLSVAKTNTATRGHARRTSEREKERERRWGVWRRPCSTRARIKSANT